MNFDKGIYAIEHINSTFGLYYQMLSLRSFGKIKTYADELADLVKVSKIDTKKFGNNISSHINFKNVVINSQEGDTQLTLKQLTPVRLMKNEFFKQVFRQFKNRRMKTPEIH